MGRRTTSTTKGGKFMNPTDQARKEARRRELKKNKKQRIAVRQAVIKTKDPQQMVKELEDLDDMELNPGSEFHYNEKVIKDKRRKLLETLVRIVDFYCKEDRTRGHEFKTMIEMYKNNRLKKEMYYESVKNAQTVEITSIPLPDAPFETPHLSDIPLPGIQPQSILKKQPPGPPSGLPPTLKSGKTPPGPPPGVPPAKKIFGKGPDVSHSQALEEPETLQDEMDEEDPYDPEEGPELMDTADVRFNLPPDLDDDDEEFHHRDDDDDGMLRDGDQSDDDTGNNKKRSIRFADEDKEEKGGDAEDSGPSTVTPLQAMMLKMAGQNMPPPPKNRNPVHRDEEADYEMDEEEGGQMEDENDRSRPKPPGPPPGLPPGPPPGMPPNLMQRPGILPPGPPPGRPPTMPPNINRRPDVRGMIDRQENEGRIPDRGMRMMQNPNILSAPPSLIHRPEKEADETQAATIVAKPKLTTNPKVDSTRFMPTSLRVRRETKAKGGKGTNESISLSTVDKQRTEKKKKHGANTADAAYDSFMKEMQGLL